MVLKTNLNTSDTSDPITEVRNSHKNILKKIKNKLFSIFKLFLITGCTPQRFRCHEAIPMRPSIEIKGPPMSDVQKPVSAAPRAHICEFTFNERVPSSTVVVHCKSVWTCSLRRNWELFPPLGVNAPHPLT